MLCHTSNIRLTLVQLDLQGYNPETDRVYCKLGTKVWVIIQIRRQWDLNPRPLAWWSGNLTTTLRSPDLKLVIILITCNPVVKTKIQVQRNMQYNILI